MDEGMWILRGFDKKDKDGKVIKSFRYFVHPPLAMMLQMARPDKGQFLSTQTMQANVGRQLNDAKGNAYVILKGGVMKKLTKPDGPVTVEYCPRCQWHNAYETEKGEPKTEIGFFKGGVGRACPKCSKDGCYIKVIIQMVDDDGKPIPAGARVVKTDDGEKRVRHAA